MIGHLDFLRRLLSSSHEDTELLIPKAVLTELDAFKSQHREIDIYIGRKSIKQDMWCAARDATNWLLQATQAHERVKLQKMNDEPKEIRQVAYFLDVSYLPEPLRNIPTVSSSAS